MLRHLSVFVILAAVIASALIACSGGGGGTTINPPPTQTTPPPVHTTPPPANVASITIAPVANQNLITGAGPYSLIGNEPQTLAMTFKDAGGNVIHPTPPTVTSSNNFVLAVNQAPGSAQFTIRGLQAGQTATLSATIGTVNGNATIHTVEGIWVANSGNRTLSLFSANDVLPGGGTTLNVSPVGTVNGTNTGLVGPTAVQVGSDGSLYVLNGSNGEIYIYAPTDLATVGGAAANIAPRAVFKSTLEGFSLPRDIFIHPSSGDLWEVFGADSTTSTPAIALYSANALKAVGGSLGSPADLAPFHTIAGNLVGLTTPQGIVVDGNGVSSGLAYVVDSATPALNLYSISDHGTNGNFAPKGIITGASTLLNSPLGVAEDNNGNVYISNTLGDTSGSVIMFTGSPQIASVVGGGSGNIAPLKATTGVSGPTFLWVDPRHNVLVPDGSNNSFSVYNAPLAGSDAPTNIIQGSHTFLNSPNSIATAP